MIRSISLLVALSGLSFVRLAGQVPVSDSLTVEQAVRLVLATHPAARQAAEGLAASEAQVAQSRSRYYPQVSAVGSATRSAPIPSIEIAPGTAFSLAPRMRYVSSVSVHQTVWDFGERSAMVEFARTRGPNAQAELALVQSSLAFRTIDGFYAALFLEQSLQVQDEQIDALAHHLAVATERASTGAATDFDVLTTQVRVATARSQRIDVASQLDRQRIELRQLLGLPDERSLNFKGAFMLTPIGLDVDSLLTAALASRQELLLARDAEASAAAARRVASMGHRPELSVDVQAGVRNGYVPNLDRMKGNWDATVSVRVPVFDGGRTRAQVDEAEAGLRAARERTRTMERRVEGEVREAISDVRASLAKLETSDLQVDQAEAAVSLAETRYRAGVSTNLEVLDAQTALSQARLLQLRAQYGFVRSRYNLERAVGATPW